MLDTLLNSLYLAENKLRLEIAKLEKEAESSVTRPRRGHESPLSQKKKKLAELEAEEALNAEKLATHLGLDIGYRQELNSFRDFAQRVDAADRTARLQREKENPGYVAPPPAFKSRDSVYVEHFDAASNPNLPKARREHTLDDLTKYRLIFSGDYDMVHHW